MKINYQDLSKKSFFCTFATKLNQCKIKEELLKYYKENRAGRK